MYALAVGRLVGADHDEVDVDPLAYCPPRGHREIQVPARITSDGDVLVVGDAQSAASLGAVAGRAKDVVDAWAGDDDPLAGNAVGAHDVVRDEQRVRNDRSCRPRRPPGLHDERQPSRLWKPFGVPLEREVVQRDYHRDGLYERQAVPRGVEDAVEVAAQPSGCRPLHPTRRDAGPGGPEWV